jgi:hypothetical protein
MIAAEVAVGNRGGCSGAGRGGGEELVWIGLPALGSDRFVYRCCMIKSIQVEQDERYQNGFASAAFRLRMLVMRPYAMCRGT